MPANQPTRRTRKPVDVAQLQRNLRTIFLFLLVLAVGLAGGVVIGRGSVTPANSNSPFPDLEAVTDVVLGNYFYRPSSEEERTEFENQLEQSAIAGMLTSLNDEYTRFLPPAEATYSQDELDGEYGGIGVVVAVDGNGMSVSQVHPGSPAGKAGLRAGDVIQRIDGRPVAAISDLENGADIRGAVGSTVVLTISRADGSGSEEISVVREAIIVHPVSWELIEGTTYLRIKIDIFGDLTVKELDQALAFGSQNGVTGVILDLRGNGGGWVSSAQQTLGRFLDPAVGPALYEDVSPGPGGETALPIDGEGVTPSKLPMIVLVDGNTASAAEIVAGSLRDYDRALVIGEPTFGKGSVQRIFDFANGSSLRVTVAEWLTPSKGRIQDQGIQPDLQITVGDGNASGDPFVAAAVGFLSRGITSPTLLASMQNGTPVPPVATPAS